MRRIALTPAEIRVLFRLPDQTAQAARNFSVGHELAHSAFGSEPAPEARFGQKIQTGKPEVSA